MSDKIPKIIHFIWAGGEKIMPDSALKNVMKWAEANPDFIVKIWVDPVTDPEVSMKYRTQMQSFDRAGQIQNIKISDINQDGICTPEIRYEIDHLSPNYGASSDMLRYNILYKEGGAYFDCGDVFPNDNVRLGDIVFPKKDWNEDENVFDTVLPAPRLLIHVTPHVMHDPLKSDKNREAPGTEAIICTPQHPLMHGIAEQARAAYHGTKWNYKLLQYEYNYTESSAISPPKPRNIGSQQPSLEMSGTQKSRVNELKGSFGRRPRGTGNFFVNERASAVDQHEITKRRALDTLNLTGPGMAVEYLQKALGDEKLPPQYLMPRTEERLGDWVSLPKDHSLAWAPFRVLPNSFTEAISSAVKSINFELEEMNIFNFNAHVEQITCAVENAKKAGKPTGITYGNIASLKTQVSSALLSNFSNDERFRMVSGMLVKRSLLSPRVVSK